MIDTTRAAVERLIAMHQDLKNRDIADTLLALLARAEAAERDISDISTTAAVARWEIAALRRACGLHSDWLYVPRFLARVTPPQQGADALRQAEARGMREAAEVARRMGALHRTCDAILTAAAAKEQSDDE